MRLAVRFSLAGWGFELDFGRVDEEPAEDVVVLSGGPMGFAAPEDEDEEFKCQ